MAGNSGPNIVNDGLVLHLDAANEKSFRGEPTTNFYTNGHFSNGVGVSQESGSNPTNTIIVLENPGASPYVLEQSMGVYNTEYQINLTNQLTSNTIYCLSGWYAESSDYSSADGSRMFHCRAFSTSGNHIALGIGIGNVIETRTINGILWKYCYTTITTPSDYSNQFDWYVGYGNNTYTGKRYYTNLQMEVGSYPKRFVNGTRGTTVATGGGWADRTPNQNHGELVNGVTYSSANRGGIVFDGTNDYVSVNSNLGVLSNYTISYWAKRDAENRMPISHRTNTSFYWFGDNSWYYTHGGVGGEYYYSKPTSIPLGTWGHYCVVYNGSNVTIYRQGIYQGQQNTTGTADWTQGLLIGYWAAGGGYAYQGTISNVNFYNRALSAQEVFQNYNTQKSRFGLP
jgi:hypothetical protein